MRCPSCDATVGVRKSLQRGKSAHPDECPDCGEELHEPQPGTILEK